MSWFEHTGTRIHFEERGEGDPVLVIPGFTEGADELEGVIAALSAHYHVIAADLPGSGKSEPQPRNYTPDYYQEDAVRMAALLEHLDAVPAHLVGFSDGGDVVLLMASSDPRLARSLFEWGAAGTLDVPNAGSMLDMLGNVTERDVEGAAGWGDYLKHKYGEEVARSTTRSYAEAARAVLARGGDISLPQVGRIECPTLIIAGEHDPFCPPEAITRLAERIPNARAITVPGAGHTVHDDRPEWFVQTLLEWLEKQ